MSNIFIESAVVAILTVTLFGCGGEADEAKKLGFANVEEMKEVQAKGWHTKERFEEDTAKQQGFKSAADMKVAIALKKEQEEKARLAAKEKEESARLAAEEKAKARKNYAKSKGDIGLYCRFTDGTGSVALIYSESKKIRLMGNLEGANWKVEESLQKLSESNIEINFKVVNEYVERINPNNGYSAELTINRESLRMRKFTHLRGGVSLDNVFDYNCSLLDDDTYADLVMYVMSAREQQQNRNKL